ncbi:cyclophilin-like fold protein [Propionivibrio limicola]|uniref:cyclophilin-like fold protein n=1 Tax=Propionivibrio limicola TaxID=167645 RepID=UPI00129143A0|nr:cyclophilin-like fold protein [Propionivibrio limicola]
MKRKMAKMVLLGSAACALLAGPMTGSAAAATQITMTVGNTVIAATLDDSATTRDFIKSLPVTMKMTRWGHREYYGKVANRLSEDAPKRNRFANGDVAYWAPGGSFAVFFNDTGNTSLSDLIVMGKVTSDLKAFDALDESVDMRIEVAK